MSKLPDYMLLRGDQPDQEFACDEELYRRVPPELWDDEGIELDAIEFPDMSVTRQKYGPPESVRWYGEEYLDWGVIFFQVDDIPPEIPYQGSVVYKMRVVHAPNKRNKPHSEVRVFESKWDQAGPGIHIDKKLMPGVPREAQQEWKELLRRRCRIKLKPGEVEASE